MSDAWNAGPALLLASSFTCPKSRSKWPEAKEIAEKYGQQLNVVIVYVIEAHPKGDVCPYKGFEDVTEENRRDGILRRQPTTMKDRLALVKEFEQYLRVDVPIYVDTMDNQAWKALGSGPNMAVLVSPGGIVAARQGWFDGPALEKSIRDALRQWHKVQQGQKAERTSDEEVRDQLKKIGKTQWELFSLADKDRLVESVAFLTQHPEFISLTVPWEPRGGEGGRTQLVYAAEHGNTALAEFLLQHGADIHAQTEHFPTALHEAAKAGDLPMIELLIRHHADVNYPAWHASVTPLREAVVYEHPEVVQALLRAGAKADFFTDIGLGNVEAVRAALKADPSRASRPDGWSRVPLDYAAATGQLEAAKLLLASGAPPGANDDRQKELPIHWAARHRHASLVELLLKAGASANSLIYPTETPLHIAAQVGAADVAKVLIDHKADLTARNMYSWTPLHTAAFYGKANVAKVLIKAGADVNAVTDKYDPPCGPFGGEPAELNTPLHLAAEHENTATTDVLIAAGAKIDALNAHGMTPLLVAVSHPSDHGAAPSNVELLLMHGANPLARNVDGRSARDLAEQAHNKKALRLLSAFGAQPAVSP